MPRTLRGTHPDRLERSCGRLSDWIRFGPSAHGVERAEVHFATRAFEPHRHDVYGIGITTSGVQTFRYRGARWSCLPGQLHILHPDETHDGAAGTERGFSYRILYIAPELIRDALAGRALPFVAEPVQDVTRAARSIAALLADIDEPIGELRHAEIAAAVADVLLDLSGATTRRPAAIDMRAIERVREHLEAVARAQTPISTLERIAGTDRYTLARHFRWAFGTSPDRYRTLRRVALARTAIEGGRSLALAAVEAGFSDQSHMTRQFKRTYGLTPGRWRALTGAASRATSTSRAHS